MLAASASPPSAGKVHKSHKRKPKRSGILAGCRSQAALDSLPRNARGANAAINRLQARHAFANPASDELGLLTPQPALTEAEAEHAGTDADADEQNEARDTLPPGSLLRTSSPARNKGRHSEMSPITTTGGTVGGGPGRLRRSLSLNRSSSSGANSALARRAPPVSSADLPPVSSDLEADVQAPLPPIGPNRARYQSMPGHPFPASTDGPASPLLGSGANTTGTGAGTGSAPSSPQKGLSSSASNKKPWGETGSPVPKGLRQSTSSPVPAKKRVVVKSMIGLPTNFQHTGHIGASAYGSAVSSVDSEALKAQLSQVAAALKFDDFQSSPDAGSAPILGKEKEAAEETTAKTEVAAEAEAQAGHSATSSSDSRGPFGASSAESAPASSRPTSMASLSRPCTPLWESSRPHTPARDSVSLASPQAPVPGPGPGPVSVPASTSGPGPSLARAPSAAGARKRKPVPKVLPEMDFESEHAKLNRQVSVVGKLPDERDFAKFVAEGSPAGRRMRNVASIKAKSGDGDKDGGAAGTPGNATLKRWGLAEAFGVGEGDESEATQQKKMVEGPAGTYITDTANFRWNSAMDEIRKALAADPAEEAEGEEEAQRQATEVLGKLGIAEHK